MRGAKIDDPGASRASVQPSPSAAARAEPEAPSALAKGLDAVKDAFIISGLINTAGTAFVHFAFDVPFDPRIALSFQAIGTMIGASYGPLKSLLLSHLSSEPVRGAPLVSERADQT